MWWIFCSVTASIASAIHTEVMWLQEHRLTHSQQDSIAQNLDVDLIVTIGIKWRIGGFPDLDANLHATRLDFAADYSNISAFVKDLGRFEMLQLAALNDQMRAMLLDNIALLIFGVVEVFLEYGVLLGGHNDGSVNPAPPTHPFEMVKFK